MRNIAARIRRLEQQAREDADNEPRPQVILFPGETNYFVAGSTVFAERASDESQEDFIVRATQKAQAIGRRTGILQTLVGYHEYPMPEGQAE